jgi:hypothetical protein
MQNLNFATPIGALSPKVSGEWSFKTTSDGYQIPSWEGQKPKTSGWVSANEEPHPGAAVKASQAFTPSREVISGQRSTRMQNLGRNFRSSPWKRVAEGRVRVHVN